LLVAGLVDIGLAEFELAAAGLPVPISVAGCAGAMAVGTLELPGAGALAGLDAGGVVELASVEAESLAAAAGLLELEPSHPNP
jgi:hypothetical protein